jgi:NADPH2:quinone reductase
MHAIRIHQTGGPEVLTFEEVDAPTPGEGQVLVEVAAAGLNYIDTYHRSGLYPMQLPITLGLEGAGTVVAVGEGANRWAVGDRVAWANALGTYAERVAVRADQAARVPDDVDLAEAAAVMLQGITAHYLANDTYPLRPGDRCLIHAGAGGVGLLLIQIAKMRGAEVFTTVGSPDKAALARAAGADHVINYRESEFGEAIESIAGPRPLAVVYDGVGKTVFDRSLELLRPRGMMVTFGNASGPVDPVSPLRLMRGGSLFLTRPTIFDYISTRAEFEHRTNDLFAWMAAGELEVRVGHRLDLPDAAEAHRMLEARLTTGKVILLP